jgi:hypothetical protein
VTARVARLFTGARCLRDTEASAAWAQDRLEEAVRATPPGSLLLSGGAEGPDTWLVEIVNVTNGELPPERRRRLVEYRANAGRYVDGVRRGSWVGMVPRRGPCKGREWFLLRDRAMVAGLAQARRDGYECSVFALHAPWAATHGTAYTARQAEEAGFVVERAHCPGELAPSNASGVEVVWVDLETGGLNPRDVVEAGAVVKHANPILEIAAVRTTPNGERVLGTFRRLVQPAAGLEITARAAAVNGYSPERWACAVPLQQALEEFAAFVAACADPEPTFGGYNPEFDLAFLDANYERLRMPAPRRRYELIDVARFGEQAKDAEDREDAARKDRGEAPLHRMPDAKLPTFCALHGLPTADAHRADVDIARTLRLYQLCRGVEPVGPQPPLEAPADASSTEAA